MHVKHRTTCRVCGNDSLLSVITFGPQYLQGSFVTDVVKPSLRKIPLELVLCNVKSNNNACGLLQLKHSVPQSILYGTYWYRSGTNATMRAHLESVAESVKPYVKSSILDIGCNDGTLLRCFRPEIKRFGIDPSNAVLEIGSDITVINKPFPCDLGYSRFDVITSLAMFYDLESPVEFAKQVKLNLAHDGLWCFEVAYLPSMLENNSFDTICHEHLEYYSLAIIEHILSRAGMHLVKAQMNSVNCGSLLCYAVNDSNQMSVDHAGLNKLRETEFSLYLEEPSTYYAFNRNVASICADIKSFVQDRYSRGDTVHIYGASTKGNTLIQACGIAEYISYAAERNESKWGASTLGTNIPIISEAASRAMAPDYYLVLPWHFKDEFVSRERLAWKDAKKKPKLIFPLPTLEIVSLD